MTTKEKFNSDLSALYTRLWQLGDTARDIIRDFARQCGGSHTFDTENDDLIYISPELYATSLETRPDGTVLIHNSGSYYELLDRMDDYNILDLARHIINL